MRAVRRVKLTYPQNLLDKPVVYGLIKQFDVVTNIRSGNFSADDGWLIVDLEGAPASIEQALAWVRDQGITVEPLPEPQ